MRSRIHISLVLFSFLISSLSHSALSVGRCNPDDYKVLMKIKQSFGNPYQLASWQPNTDCCDWYVLECDETTNRLIGLSIFSGNVSGQIPSEVGDLPFLQTLIIRKLSNITGNIPQSITKLKHLKTLRLDWLSLSGPVPGFLSELSNLTDLELSFNQFSGSIPSSFSKFTKLVALYLDRNQLTGTIPESFGHFKGTVPELYFSHNHLTGTIPKSFANLDFNRIDLSRNNLTGDASVLFKLNGTTQIVDISRNNFEFNFSNVQFPVSQLVSVDINHNKIYGGIPKGIVDVGRSLQSLNVSYNRLCGEIPTGGQMGQFDSSSYIHNKCLCGPPLTIKC